MVCMPCLHLCDEALHGGVRLAALEFLLAALDLALALRGALGLAVAALSLASLRLGVARLAWALLHAAVLDHVAPRHVDEAPGPSVALPEPLGIPARERLAATLG